MVCWHGSVRLAGRRCVGLTHFRELACDLKHMKYNFLFLSKVDCKYLTTRCLYNHLCIVLKNWMIYSSFYACIIFFFHFYINCC